MSRISFQNVRKRFGNDEVVRGIDLDIEEGEFLVIVGPSGCGKSTCLRMIAGLESTSDGSISIGERVVNDLEPKDRDIAMVFQNYALYPHMSIYKNLAYGLKNQRMAKAEIKKRIDRVADILQLDDGMLSRKPGALSGGQRQRVAMGRAIVREPQVFLFDEPLSNLDAKLRVRMRIEIQHLHKMLGITSVYVTHDQTEAMTLAQRLVVMNAGRVEQAGSPQRIYAHPDTLFVATFIGSPAMNLQNGRIRDGVFVSEGGTRWDVAGVAQSDEAAEAEVVFGIRPEHLQFAASGDAECALTVDLVEDLGADELVYGRLEDDSELVVRARLPENANIGDTVPIRRSEYATSHLFNAESGQRIN